MEKDLSIMEAVGICADIYHNKKKELNEKDFEAINVLTDYADCEYISHVENIGRIAIEDIERMEREWLDKACEWLNNATTTNHRGSEPTCDTYYYTKSEFLEAFRKAMEE